MKMLQNCPYNHLLYFYKNCRHVRLVFYWIRSWSNNYDGRLDAGIGHKLEIRVVIVKQDLQDHKPETTNKSRFSIKIDLIQTLSNIFRNGFQKLILYAISHILMQKFKHEI